MKHRYAIVLAGTTAEAHTYARRAGLSAFTYRVPASASSIRGLQSADVHVLPSFAGRRDRHGLLAELRYGRDIVMLDVVMPTRLEAPPVDQGDGMGEQLTIEDALADALANGRADEARALRVEVEKPDATSPEPETPAAEDEEPHGSTPGTTESREDAASTATRRRRSRCPGCGELTFETHDHSGDTPAGAEIF